MVARNRGVLSDFARGSDTTYQAFTRGAWALLRHTLFSAAGAAVVAGIWATQTTTYKERAAWITHQEALIRKAVPYFGSRVTFDGVSYPLDSALEDPRFLAVADSAGQRLWTAAAVGILTFAALGVWGIRRGYLRGQKLAEDRFIRGGALIEAGRLAKQLKADGKASDIMLGTVPLVRDTEFEHLLATGSTGVGKSSLVRSILDRIKARGDAAILFDPHGDLMQFFYDENRNDVVMNPLDKRSPAWSPWAEIEHPSQAERLVKSLIPKPEGGEQYWVEAAQVLTSAALLKTLNDRGRNVPSLLKVLLNRSLKDLAKLIEGTDAAAIFEEGNEKMAMSVRGTMSTYVRSLRFLRRDTRPDTEFSIRRWVKSLDRIEGPKPWMWVSSRADFHDAIRPLISVFLDTAAGSILSLPDNQTRVAKGLPPRRIWIVLDELPKLAKLPSLLEFLQEGRKFGAACLVTFQSMASLEQIYGQKLAQAISDLCKTKVIYMTGDPNTAEWASRVIGEREIEQGRETIRYAGGEHDDAVSLGDQRTIQRLVLPTEIQNLPNYTAYVRLVGYPVARTEIHDPKRDRQAAPFVELDLKETAHADPDTSSASPAAQAAEEAVGAAGAVPTTAPATLASHKGWA